MKNESADRGLGARQLRSSPPSTGATARSTSWSIGRKSDWSGSFAAPSPFDGGNSSDPTSGTASRTATGMSARRGHRNSRSGAGNRSGSRPPQTGTSSGMATARKKYAGQAGISSRQIVPVSTLTAGDEPLTTKNAASHTAKKAALGIEWRATATAPATGTNSSSRALQKYSRKPRNWWFSWWMSSGTKSFACSHHVNCVGCGGGSAAAASTAESSASTEIPVPRYFQTRSVSTAGTSASANSRPARQRRASAKATSGAKTKRPFAGFSAIASPTTTPAAMTSPRAAPSSARSTKTAATSSSTIDGKSPSAVKPSAWGSVCSFQRSW